MAPDDRTAGPVVVAGFTAVDLVCTLLALRLLLADFEVLVRYPPVMLMGALWYCFSAGFRLASLMACGPCARTDKLVGYASVVSYVLLASCFVGMFFCVLEIGGNADASAF